MPGARSVLAGAALALAAAALLRRRRADGWVVRYDADGNAERLTDERLLGIARSALAAARRP